MPRPKKFDKDEILERAMRLFWQKGFEATSIQDLVEHTGINKQSLYDTFGDKRALYAAALNHYRTANECRFGELLAEGTSAKQALRAFFDRVIGETAADADRKGCFMNNAMVELSAGDEEIGRLCGDNMRSMETKFARLIKDGQSTGEIRRALDAEATAAFLFAALSGLQAVSKITPEKEKLEQIAATSLSVLE